MHLVMLYINLKTKYISITYSACDYTYFTSKTKQVACYNIIHLKKLVYHENAVKEINSQNTNAIFQRPWKI